MPELTACSERTVSVLTFDGKVHMIPGAIIAIREKESEKDGTTERPAGSFRIFCAVLCRIFRRHGIRFVRFARRYLYGGRSLTGGFVRGDRFLSVGKCASICRLSGIAVPDFAGCRSRSLVSFRAGSDSCRESVVFFFVGTRKGVIDVRENVCPGGRFFRFRYENLCRRTLRRCP